MKDHRKILICLFLIISTLLAYWQVQNNDFIHFDDSLYVVDNPDIKTGLNLASISWAFTNVKAGFWFPMTWISHIVDYTLYGMNPKGHHFNNLLFHIANVVLLFLVLYRMTGALWRSACVSTLFALCPLNVEPVAWVSSRKDVLSTFFWMLTIYCYAIYAEKPGLKRYLLVLLAFILGLMSKPMIITLPFVLILLDYWPLNRLQFCYSSLNPQSTAFLTRDKEIQKISLMNSVIEKIPLLILSLSSFIIVYFAERQLGAIIDSIPFAVRISNAIVSYIKYIWKLIYPVNLTCFYPYPGMPEWWLIAGCGFIIIAISISAFKYSKQSPYLPVGLLWYMGTLVPVIGFIQIGGHELADRYAYVPFIGIFIILIWGGFSLFDKLRFSQIVISIIFCLLLLYSSIFTYIQLTYWKNSITLLKHAIDVTSKNYKAYYNLGLTYSFMGRFKEAEYYLSKALEIYHEEPEASDVYVTLGLISSQKDDIKGAIYNYKKALETNPKNDKAHNNLGVLYIKIFNYKEAVFHFQEALKINPDNTNAKKNLSLALEELNRM
jgi:protein O-mannosyl-transferase